MVKLFWVVGSSKFVRYNCKHLLHNPVPVLPKKCNSILCSRLTALHLFWSNFNFRCSRKVVLSGLKLFHNQWVDAHLGITTKQLGKILLELC